MQCPNCGMENMPGLATCVRCQSALQGGALVVTPRRASALRLTTRLLALWYRCFGGWRVDWSWLRPWTPRTYEPIPWRAVGLTLLAPGVGHLYIRHRALGWWLLGIWAGAIFLTLLSLATPWTPWLFSIAVIVHALAFASLLAANLGYESWIIRALFGTLLFLALNYLLYNPIAGFCGHFVRAVYLPDIQLNPTIGSGDGLVCEGDWLRSAPCRGDIVLYDMTPYSGNGWYVREGVGIDRIVGLPGDRIEITNGFLRVNGAEVAKGMAPLGAVPPIASFSCTVAPDRVFVLPTTLRLYLGPQMELRPEFIETAAHLDREQIRGKVLWRVRPWSRWGRVE
ncbi:MAG: hypothetical protein AMXMBFR47_39500 [Planctomycetota bacterium]